MILIPLTVIFKSGVERTYVAKSSPDFTMAEANDFVRQVKEMVQQHVTQALPCSLQWGCGVIDASSVAVFEFGEPGYADG